MKMEGKKPDLQQETLKNHPFGVPEGYFESFSDRLQKRIKTEGSSGAPVRKIGTTTRILALAAAIFAAALITTSILRFTNTENGSGGLYPDLAILEQMQVFDDDRYLYEILEEESDPLDEDEAFASQAIEYLAINDVEMDLIFE